MRETPSKRRYELSPEGRECLRAAALRDKPWTRSTGPTSEAGKEVSRFNAWRHGDRSALIRHARVEMRRTFQQGTEPDSVDPSEIAKFACPTSYRQSLLGFDALAKRHRAAATAGAAHDQLTGSNGATGDPADHDVEVRVPELPKLPVGRVNLVAPDEIPHVGNVAPLPMDSSTSWDFVPAARFLRAVQLAEECQTLPPNAKSDQLIGRAFCFIKGGRRRSFDSSLWEAHQLFLRGGNTRWMTEAALIGGLSPVGVSELVPVSPTTIAVYQDFFYDVRRFLKCRPFMLSQLLPFDLMGVLPDDPDTFWKLLAYVGGVRFWQRYMDPAGVFDTNEWATFCGMIRHAHAKLALVAAWRTIPGGENAAALAATHLRLEDAAARKKGRGDGRSAVSEMNPGFIQGAGELLRGLPVLPPPDPIAGLSHRSEGLPLTSAGVQPADAV